MSKEMIEGLLSELKDSEFRWIDPKEIIVAQWVRMKCTYGCSGYGMGTCPPNTPSVDECERFFKEYKSAVLIRFTKYADKNAYPSEWSRATAKKLLEIERQAFLSGYHKAFLVNHTCCSECSECSESRVGCIDKKNARPSPESMAVDVYQTVRNSGMEIHVVPDTPSDITRIGILLVE